MFNTFTSMVMQYHAHLQQIPAKKRCKWKDTLQDKMRVKTRLRYRDGELWNYARIKGTHVHSWLRVELEVVMQEEGIVEPDFVAFLQKADSVDKQLL